MAEYPYAREELTIDARARHWDIFKPDWEYLRSFPALSLCSLVGLSIGLHPWFSRPDWVFHCAKPYFEGERDSELDEPVTEDDQAKADDLHRFLKRIHIAAGNLAPAGSLTPIDGIAQGEATFVKVAEFLAFAGRLGWALPEEFRQFEGHAIQTDTKSRLINQKRDEDFNQWIVDKKPDLNGMTREEIKNALHAWSQIKPAIWVSGFDGWWKKQSIHKGKPGRKPG